MKDTSVHASAKLWAHHTLAYYQDILPTRYVRSLLGVLVVLLVVTSTVTAWALPSSVVKWFIGDVVDEQYIVGPEVLDFYTFLREEDAEESTYRFSLEMPQTVQEYIELIYLYEMSDDLLQAMGAEFVKPDEITMWSEGENEEAMDAVGQFIENRPPKVVVDVE